MFKGKMFLFILASFFGTFTVLADTSLWSDYFYFDGDIITEEAILLKPTDDLAYSSAMVDGNPKSLVITVEDKDNPEIASSVFTDYSGTEVEGTVTWNYTDEDYNDFPTDDTYLLKEKIESDTNSKIFTRLITILPEPASFLAMWILVALCLRKKVKHLLIFSVAVMISSTNLNADSSVTEVSCMQMWPFDRSVIINFTVETDSTNALPVKFFGSANDGWTTFDLKKKGTISKDGSNGTITGSGKYKALWTPDESFDGFATEEMMIKVEIEEKMSTYMVIDLSSGSITYLDDVPEGGWTDEYKTTKMVLRRIEAGTFTMGSPEDEYGRYDEEVQHQVTLTKDYYIGVFEVTQKQFEMVTYRSPSRYTGDMRPVESVSYDMLRGKKKGAAWPYVNEVDYGSFFWYLRYRTNKPFDLPTEAQWECACRAGTTTSLNNGTDVTNYFDANMNKLGRYDYNFDDGKGGYSDAHTTVGSYLPNAWGLYDMHGNVSEWCLDWFDWDYDNSKPVTDPLGSTEGSYHIIRGGDFDSYATSCRSARRGRCYPDEDFSSIGFRVAFTVSTDDDDDKYAIRYVDDDGESKKYMVIELWNGEITYLDDVPEGGWTDEYKTTKMVLRRIEAGTFTMGSPEDEYGRDDEEVQHQVTLTKDYYIGVFEVTQKQFEMVTYRSPSKYTGDMRPVESVSYDMLRGKRKGAVWPYVNEVDYGSFLWDLRYKTNKPFDLPTEAQWEYACRAGTTTSLNNGTDVTNYFDANMNKLGRYDYNSDDGKGGYSDAHTTVGSYLPNAWGLYDMHGNVWEWCLDWFDWDYDNSKPVTDPLGSTEGSYHIIRGGGCDSDATSCRSASRGSYYPDEDLSSIGFRIALTVSNDGNDEDDEDGDDGETQNYMIIDLDSGSVNYRNSVPKNGWGKKYKTEKMVLKKINAGKFVMGSPTDELGREENEIQHEVTLTKDFYIGIFEITQRQYEVITGKVLPYYTGDKRPLYNVSYNFIRGLSKGAGWPNNSEIDDDSFLYSLRARTNKAFDLPTEAQWEYACRAGTTTALNDGNNITNEFEDGNLNKLGRYFTNREDNVGGYIDGPTTVGSYLPNAWGLYDMHGNVWEWCLDWNGEYQGNATDPKGPDSGDNGRILRGGGCYTDDASWCRSAHRYADEPIGYDDSDYGFRVIFVP